MDSIYGNDKKENCYNLVKNIYELFSKELGKNFKNTTATKYKLETTQMLYDMIEGVLHNYDKYLK